MINTFYDVIKSSYFLTLMTLIYRNQQVPPRITEERPQTQEDIDDFVVHVHDVEAAAPPVDRAQRSSLWRRTKRTLGQISFSLGTVLMLPPAGLLDLLNDP